MNTRQQTEMLIEIFETKIRQALSEAIAEVAMMAMQQERVPEKPSGLPAGVTIDKRSGKYGAKIKVGGKLIWLGTYESADDASMAFRAAKAKRDAGLMVA